MVYHVWPFLVPAIVSFAIVAIQWTFFPAAPMTPAMTFLFLGIGCTLAALLGTKYEPQFRNAVVSKVDCQMVPCCRQVGSEYVARLAERPMGPPRHHRLLALKRDTPALDRTK